MCVNRGQERLSDPMRDRSTSSHRAGMMLLPDLCGLRVGAQTVQRPSGADARRRQGLRKVAVRSATYRADRSARAEAVNAASRTQKVRDDGGEEAVMGSSHASGSGTGCYRIDSAVRSQRGRSTRNRVVGRVTATTTDRGAIRADRGGEISAVRRETEQGGERTGGRSDQGTIGS